MSATCLEVAALSGSNEECTDLRARARSWARVVALVDAYARGLRSAASNHAEGLLTGALPVDAAGDLWPGLSPAQAQAAKGIASALEAMLVGRPSESDLRSTIETSDAAVQELARGIDEMIAHELERLDLARTSIGVVRDRLAQFGAAAPPGARRPAPAHAPAPPADAHPPDKTAALVAAEVAPVREALAALQDRLDEALSERATERQVAVPGSLAELGLMQNDLESKRARLERLRDAADVFARAHKTLHDNLARLGSDALLAEVVRAIAQPQAPRAIPSPR
jgi:hypothetical protein